LQALLVKVRPAFVAHLDHDEEAAVVARKKAASAGLTRIRRADNASLAYRWGSPMNGMRAAAVAGNGAAALVSVSTMRAQGRRRTNTVTIDAFEFKPATLTVKREIAS
jgi:hypothetical protein